MAATTTAEREAMTTATPKAAVETTEKPTHANAWAALVELQGELPVVDFDRENPHFHNRYATLTAIVKEVRPLRRKHGFAWLCLPRLDEQGTLGLDYKLIWRDGTVVADGRYPLVEGTPQQIGSSLTYGRRYTECAVLGIVADEDDDGNAASTGTSSARRGSSEKPGIDRPWQEGDPCPAQGCRGKFRDGKYGLQCTGKTGESWNNHKPPAFAPPQAEAAPAAPAGLKRLGHCPICKEVGNVTRKGHPVPAVYENAAGESFCNGVDEGGRPVRHTPELIAAFIEQEQSAAGEVEPEVPMATSGYGPDDGGLDIDPDSIPFAFPLTRDELRAHRETSWAARI